MLPSFFTAFHGYFEKRRNMMMSLTQALTVAAIMCWPAISNFCMDRYGFRGTVAIFAALSLNALPAALALQPVEWHLKKRELTLEEAEKQVDERAKPDVEEKLLDGEGLKERRGSYVVKKPRPSIVSLGSLAASVRSKLDKVHEDANETGLTKWERFSKAMDLELFKDPSYLNMSFGLSLSFLSDLSFIAIFPLILKNLNFATSEITMIMTIFFGTDLVCRILLTLVSGVVSIRNKYLFLGGTLLSAVFRVGKVNLNVLK